MAKDPAADDLDNLSGFIKGPLGYPLRYLEATQSTNDDCTRWAADGAPHGALVVAGHQTAGRGRRGRRWVDSGDSLLFSLVLRPVTPIDQWSLISLGAAVAVAYTLRAHGVPALVKWPNDVLLEGQKVAGVLSEVAGGAVICGVGLNVGLAAGGEASTGLHEYANRPFHRGKLLAAILAAMDELYSQPATIVNEYRHICETLGRRVSIESEAGLLSGVAVGIEDSGALRLADGGCVYAGDVVHVR